MSEKLLGNYGKDIEDFTEDSSDEFGGFRFKNAK